VSRVNPTEPASPFGSESAPAAHTELTSVALPSESATVDRLQAELERDGIVILPPLVSEEQLHSMQRAFEARLHRVRWNDLDGYEKELYRHVVQDVLTLDQGFVDIAIHPVVTALVRGYLGNAFALVEAKGWKSLPTNHDFHGWHGDAWYDQETIKEIPRELKLGFYLTDVRSGAFNYIGGSHRKQHPRPVPNAEVPQAAQSLTLELAGPAGTAFLFDTSGIHRQGVPIIEPRQAVFYNYHDPNVRLQKESEDYYRYHPLLLSAAFLGGLSTEEQRILGFGNKVRYKPAFERTASHARLQRLFSVAHGAALRLEDLSGRAGIRLTKLLKR
jgi:Phytanoyl-CoA dioxygenase (PhyH)